MNSSRVYLPLSLALLLSATTTSAAIAGSALDPYSHIKAPVPAKQTKKNVPVTQMDQIEQETRTYVNMKMDHLAEDDKAAQKKGLIGKMTSPFAKGGQMFANSASKAKGVIPGLKGDDKDQQQAKQIAAKPKKESPNKTAAKTKSVDDWYTEATAAAVAQSDNGKHAEKILKQDASKSTGMQTAFLGQKSKKGSLTSKLNPFSKLAKKPTPGASVRPESGFTDAVSNPDEEALAEIKAEKARLAQMKKEKEEKFTPIVDTPEDIKAKTAQQNSAAKHVAQKPAAKPVQKKSKFGGLSIAKFKPSMPSMPGFKKGNKDAKPQIAATPNKVAAPVKHQPQAQPQVAIDPREENDLMAEGTETPAHAQPSMAFNTGDKEIDSASAKTPTAHVNKVAKEPKKGKFQGLAKMPNFSKFNLLNKKKPAAPAQTANKADATKQM